jgi:four helix bundle protein
MLDLKDRTKQFALRIIRLVDALPRKRSAEVIGKQLLRSATSVGANYRAARRARGTAGFQANLVIVEEEANESVYWLELLAEPEWMKPAQVRALLVEACEITAIIVSSIKTSKATSKRIAKPKDIAL